MGAPLAAASALLLEQVAGALSGGVDFVQLRERDLDAAAYVALIRDCLVLARGTKCRVVVNDRLDLALAASADGVHLRESSYSAEAVRQNVGPGVIVGRSVHDAPTAASTRTADYLIAGSVFETESKRGRHAVLGVEGLRQIVIAAGNCPVWAVGGVTSETVERLHGCGAQGLAAIGAFVPDGRPNNLRIAVHNLTERLRFCLDRLG